MTPADFNEVLRLLDSALALFERGHHRDPAVFQREMRALSLELDVMRVRLGHRAAMLGRN